MKKDAWLWGLMALVGVLVVVVVRQQSELARLREPASKPVVRVPVAVNAVRPVKPVAPPVIREPEAEAPAPPPAAKASEPQTPNWFAKVGEMSKDPAFKDMIRNQQRMSLDMTHGSLFKTLDLSTEDLDSLKQLVVDRQMALMDVSMGLISGGVNAADRGQKVKAIEAIKAEHDKKIEEFLGTEDYAVFKQYEETQAERMQVSLFKHSLGGADALTEQQETDLVAAMYVERKALPEAGAMQKTVPDPAKFTTEGIAEMQKQLDQLQTRYLHAAESVLSPTQFDQFKKSLEQQRAMQTMGLKMAAQMFGQQKATKPQVTPGEQ